MGTSRDQAETYTPRTFTTAYAFRCGCCDEPYEAGTRAMYGRGSLLLAVGCPNLPDADPEVLFNVRRSGEEGYVPTEAEQEEARRKRCDKCFLVHAPHQEECA